MSREKASSTFEFFILITSTKVGGLSSLITALKKIIEVDATFFDSDPLLAASACFYSD